MSMYTIPKSISDQIDAWVAKYPEDQKRSAVVAALMIIQEENAGSLTEAQMNAVAQYLDQPPIVVYELATFYDMFELKPIGKHKIGICTNLSCKLMGADKIVEHVQKKLGVGLGETTADGKFTLRECECLAACGIGPVCQIDNKKYEGNLTPEKIDEILQHLQQSDGGNPER